VVDVVGYAGVAAVTADAPGNLMPADTLLNIGGVAAGILLGPTVLISLGLSLGRRQPG